MSELVSHIYVKYFTIWVPILCQLRNCGGEEMRMVSILLPDCYLLYLLCGVATW